MRRGRRRSIAPVHASPDPAAQWKIVDDGPGHLGPGQACHGNFPGKREEDLVGSWLQESRRIDLEELHQVDQVHQVHQVQGNSDCRRREVRVGQLGHTGVQEKRKVEDEAENVGRRGSSRKDWKENWGQGNPKNMMKREEVGGPDLLQTLQALGHEVTAHFVSGFESCQFLFIEPESDH